MLSVGRLEENKGFHVLAAALAELRARAGQRRRLALGAGRRRSVPPRIDGAAAPASLACTWPDA